MVSGTQRAHLLLYCQASSDCGRYAAYGTNFGQVVVFELGRALKSDNVGAALAEASQPRATLQAFDNCGVYSLSTWREFLICGGVGSAVAYRWRELVRAAASSSSSSSSSSGQPRPAWTVHPPSGPADAVAELNSLAIVDYDSGPRLACGCGDGRVHSFDLEAGGQPVSSLPPAADYIHKVAASRQLLAAASEDGGVRLYDLRESSAASPSVTLRPDEHQQLRRPQLGKWVTSLACRSDSSDWLVCGGGPRLAVWHIASAAPTAVLQTSDTFVARDACMDGDRVLAGGNAACVHYFSAGGSALATAACSVPQLLSVAQLPPSGSDSKRLVSACGLGKSVDVCSELGYRLASLSV